VQAVVGRVGIALLALVAALAVGVSLVAVRAGSASLKVAAPVCTDDSVCATSSDRPDAVSASTATAARNVGQDTSLTNGSKNRISLVRFTQVVPAGFTFLQDTLGVCTESAGTVTCDHGQLLSGQSVSNTLVYRTPVLAAGTEETSMFAATWCWDGCASHDAGANRVDSLDVPEETTVEAVGGFDATYLLAGTDAVLATGSAPTAANPLAGTWTIPGQAKDLPATATERPNPPGFQQCPADGKLCRSGDWFRALSPGTSSFSPYSTIVYTQFKSLIPKGTTAANYEVVYTSCLPGDDSAHPDGCVLERLPRCASAADLRCTEFVTKIGGGSYRVGVRIGSHNGYMK
jgi:hypothetical protein